MESQLGSCFLIDNANLFNKRVIQPQWGCLQGSSQAVGCSAGGSHWQSPPASHPPTKMSQSSTDIMPRRSSLTTYPPLLEFASASWRTLTNWWCHEIFPSGISTPSWFKSKESSLPAPPPDNNHHLENPSPLWMTMEIYLEALEAIRCLMGHNQNKFPLSPHTTSTQLEALTHKSDTVLKLHPTCWEVLWVSNGNSSLAHYLLNAPLQEAATKQPPEWYDGSIQN